MSTIVRASAVIVAVSMAGAALGVPPPTTQPDRGPTTRPAAPARPVEPNPPAKDFDAAHSDAKAIELADRTMQAMGGRAAWDRTRCIAWTFFGARHHVWDKATGDVRVDTPASGDRAATTVVVNLDTKAGRAWVGGVAVTDEATLAGMLEQAESAWINDAYWLLMPYKLKDGGVTLKYVGEREMIDGAGPAEVVELTFAGVGRTPGNKYHVYVSSRTGLVEQWDFYRDASDEKPMFQIPWREWTKRGDIMLSGDRGQRKLTDIVVMDEPPANAFTDPAPVTIPAP